MRKTTALLAAAAAVLMLAATLASADEQKEQKMEPKWTMTPTGLKYQDIKEGDGPSPKNGQTCVVHYTGWLWEDGAKGKKFDSSVDRGQPFEFSLGMGRVIKGWDQGVVDDEGRRQAPPARPAAARLRRARRRIGDPGQRDAAFRGGAARGQMTKRRSGSFGRAALAAALRFRAGTSPAPTLQFASS